MKFIYLFLTISLLAISGCTNSKELSKEEIDQAMQEAINSNIKFITFDVPIYYEVDSNTRNPIANSVYKSVSNKLLIFSTYENHLINKKIPDILITGNLNDLCLAMAFYAKYNKYYKKFNNFNESTLKTHNWIIESHKTYLEIINTKFPKRIDNDCRDFK